MLVEVRLGKRKPLLDSFVDFPDFNDAFSKVAMFQRGGSATGLSGDHGQLFPPLSLYFPPL